MTTTTENTAKIAEAIAAFQKEAPTVHKGKTANVPTKNGGFYSYTYAGLAEVVAAATPLLVKHGLSFSCCPERNDDGSYSLTGVLLHTSGERLHGSLPLAGRTAQEIGSSITYGRRYLLGCMTGLVTDDDDDGALANDAQRARATSQSPPTDMELAQRRVRQAWESTRSDAFTVEALVAYAGFDVMQAEPRDLHNVADRLLQDGDQGGEG